MSEFKKTSTIKLAERPPELAIQTRSNADKTFVLGFIGAMARLGMPGAKKLYTKPPEIKPPSFIGKYLLGKTAETRGGSPVFGYPIGTLKITGELECRRIVYLCENNQLKVYENTSGGYIVDDTEAVTDLGNRDFEIGQVYDYHDDLDEWDRNHQPAGIKCHIMPLKDLLVKTMAEQLNAV